MNCISWSLRKWGHSYERTYVCVQKGAKVSLLASPSPQPKMAHHEGQNGTQLSLASGLQPQTWVKKTCNYNKATAAVWSIYPPNTCMYVCKDPLWHLLWGVHPLDWQCNYNQLDTKVLNPWLFSSGAWSTALRAYLPSGEQTPLAAQDQRPVRYTRVLYM